MDWLCLKKEIKKSPPYMILDIEQNYDDTFTIKVIYENEDIKQIKLTGFELYNYHLKYDFDISEYLIKYSKYEILDPLGDVCLESDPCQHYVRVRDENNGIKTIIMNGVQIYEYYALRNKIVPDHFKMYKKYT